MSNTATRTLLRYRSVQPRAGRVSYNVARAPSLGATAPYTTQPICQGYKQRLFLKSIAPASTSSYIAGARNIHATTAYFKKPKPSPPPPPPPSDDGSTHPVATSDDPLNFADVNSRLQQRAEKSKAALKMQTAARFDPDVVGGLPVTIDKKTGETYPLRELAQVVPRGGRAVSFLVHEAEYVQPIMSAVQKSPKFNQQPQRDPDNELELVLKVEAERPEDVIKRIKVVTNEWRERIRYIRQKRDKLHATWKKAKEIVPDMQKKADQEVEKIIKAAIAEVKEAEKAAIKAVEG
ncbi:ribosome recycling factor [Xylaria bambusicola]|uniref:ribosome recycling factor n=1 Tax=Xylaria bambusicola TaxID=326684 RepID=UPI002007AF43|nr:ribosome recycling factor [Xylaria bambusicola]KAI0521544.1 ribosome recycling factor [Xylaria bambusicola]